MHLLLPSADYSAALAAEIHRTLPGSTSREITRDLLALETPGRDPECLPRLVFARQWLPHAHPVAASSIRGFADLAFEALGSALPRDVPWRFHLDPHFGGPDAGRNRCALIRETLFDRLRRHRRHLLRQHLDSVAAFSPEETLVQLLLTAPDAGFLSILPAPGPGRSRHRLSPFPKGEVPIAVDKAAPCRAFAKLVEAEQRLGRPITPGETCVDLGACPGSWSYVALARGARVTAVDRSPLREDLMRHPRLTFHQGDAFAFQPSQTVDWLLCDVIAAPDRSIDLVLDWCRRRLCRHFVVTIKFKGTGDYAVLDQLAEALVPLAGEDFLLTRLCANKNEVCVAGSVVAGH